MKPAVLAYCQEACPIVDSEYVMSPGTKLVHRMLKGDWTQWELQCWNGGTCQWERAFCASPYMGDDDPHFGYLYRIFGLEKMDERESMMKTVDALSAMVSVDPVAYSDLEDALEAEKEKSKRWESRAWKILQIVRRRETEQRPKTAAVLRTLREVSEKNEQLVRELNGLLVDTSHDTPSQVYSHIERILGAYKEGKKDEN